MQNLRRSFILLTLLSSPIRAEDAEAVGPVIDLDTPRGITRIELVESTPDSEKGVVHEGRSLAVGDLNGDGTPDLAIGTRRYYGSDFSQYYGRVYIFLSVDQLKVEVEPPSLDKASFFLESPKQSVEFGSQLKVMDFDGDKIDDLIIGDPSDSTVEGGGAVFILFGGPNLLDECTEDAVEDDSCLGLWLTGEEDEGLGSVLEVALPLEPGAPATPATPAQPATLLLGAPGAADGVGRVYLISPTSETRTATLQPQSLQQLAELEEATVVQLEGEPGSGFGLSLASFPDGDGRGWGLAISAPNLDLNQRELNVGRVSLFAAETLVAAFDAARAGRTIPVIDFTASSGTLTGTNENQSLGSTLLAVPDSDSVHLYVGASGYQSSTGTNTGAVFLWEWESAQLSADHTPLESSDLPGVVGDVHPLRLGTSILDERTVEPGLPESWRDGLPELLLGSPNYFRERAEGSDDATPADEIGRVALASSHAWEETDAPMESLQPLLTFVSDESYNLGTAVGIAELDPPHQSGEPQPDAASEYLFLALGTNGKPPGRLYIVWDAPRRYFDRDGDGYVSLSDDITYGAEGSSFSKYSGDCLEDNSAVNYDQFETLEFCADGLDNDCNGGVDDGEDGDGDKFGVCHDCDDADKAYVPEPYTGSGGDDLLVCAQPFSCRDEGWPTSDPGGCLSWTTGPPKSPSQGTSSGLSGVILLGGLTVLRLRRR